MSPKTIMKLWKVCSTFKFNPAENYIEKVMKLMYKKTENKYLSVMNASYTLHWLVISVCNDE